MTLTIVSTLAPDITCDIECFSVLVADTLAAQLEEHETADLVCGNLLLRSYSVINGQVIAFTPDHFTEVLSLVKGGH